ncbi:unnamed protein product [Agarophyton chilense]
MLSPRPPSDAMQMHQTPAENDADGAQLQHVESLLMERLMNRSLPAASPSFTVPEPPSVTFHHQTRRERRQNKQGKRPRTDRLRIEAFRHLVARKETAAKQAALAIATVRPRRVSPPPPTSTPSAPTSVAAVPTLVVKQLSPTLPSSNRRKLASDSTPLDHTLVDAAHFVNAHRTEVGDFGSQALRRRDRKKYHTAKLVKLGCRPPKNQKMPIGLLQKRRKREKLNAQKQKKRDLATGMLLRIKRR